MNGELKPLHLKSAKRSMNVAKKTATIALMAVVLGLSACKDSNASNKKEAKKFISSATNYQQQGQFRAAILEAKNAIQKDPNNPQALNILAQIYNQLGAYSATQSLLEQHVKQSPEVSLNLAEAYLNNNKFRSVLATLADFKAQGISDEDAAKKLALIARANIRLGDQKASEDALQELKKLPAAADEYAYVEVEYLLSKGQLEDVKPKLESLAANPKGNPKSLIILGGLALQSGNLLLAEERYTKALSLIPKSDIFTTDKTIVLTQLTEVLIQQGKTSEALTYQKLLAEANPDSQGAQQKLMDAMEYYRQGKFSDAEKLLTELREQFPQDKNSAMLMGMVQFQQGQDQQANQLFDKFIDPETANTTIIQAAALAKFRANQIDDALVLLKKSVDSQPDNAEILATYGLALLDKDPVSNDGERAIEKSLALNPKQQRLRLALAKRYITLHQTEQAVAQLQKAYSEQPLDLIIQQAYFKLLLSEKKDDVLKSSIAEFEKKFPDNARGPFLEGWYGLAKKSYAEAEKGFEKALTMKSKEDRNLSYAGLAQVYTEQKLYQKSAAAWKSAIKEDPTVLNAYVPWLAQMQQLGNEQEIVSFLTELENKNSLWQPSAVFAQYYLSQKKYDLAINHVEKAIELSKGSDLTKQYAANIYQTQGLDLMAQNKPADAKTVFLKATTLQPKNTAYVVNLVEAEVALKNLPEAQKIVDQLDFNDEIAPSKAYLMGRLSAAQGNQDEALKHYLNSWKLKPVEFTAELIYEVYSKAGKTDVASKFAKEWSEKLPKSERALLILAVEAQQNKDAAGAIKLYEKTLEIAPNNAAAANNLAWLYYENKNPKASDMAKKATELAPNVPAILDTYGWILVETGRVDEGIQYLEKAAAGAGANAEIQGHLKDAKARKK